MYILISQAVCGLKHRHFQENSQPSWFVSFFLPPFFRGVLNERGFWNSGQLVRCSYPLGYPSYHCCLCRSLADSWICWCGQMFVSVTGPTLTSEALHQHGAPLVMQMPGSVTFNILLCSCSVRDRQLHTEYGAFQDNISQKQTLSQGFEGR